MERDSQSLEKWLWLCVSAFAFAIPISIALVQPAVYLGSIGAIYYLWKYKPKMEIPFPFLGAILLFMIAVIIASAVGVRPATSFRKINRFIVLMMAWLIPVLLFHSKSNHSFRIDRLVMLFVLGTSLRAAYDLVRVPIMMSMDISLFLTGNMRDPQMYLVGICLAGGMLMTGKWSFRYPPTAAGFLLTMCGMIIHFKRGAWTACLGALMVMALASRKWRPLAYAGLVLVLLISIPSVRERLGQLSREFDPKNGGRLVLWTEVAPVLITDHPAGMGWKSVKHEDFTAVSDRVEPKLNHLHNNILEITLELGWLGLLAWLYWMGLVLVKLWGGYRKYLHLDATLSGVALGGLGAFSGLMMNGLVEYNFGDSEIFMMMVFIMGLAAGVSQYTGTKIQSSIP